MAPVFTQMLSCGPVAPKYPDPHEVSLGDAVLMEDRMPLLLLYFTAQSKWNVLKIEKRYYQLEMVPDGLEMTNN